MFNAVQFCIDNSIDYRTSGKNVSEGWVGVQDIYATSDTGFHLGINIIGGYLYSWKTGHHRLDTYVQDVLHVDYRHAQRIIKQYTVEDIPDMLQDVQPKQEFHIVDTPTTPAIRNYIRHRRYNAKKLIEKYDIRGDGTKMVIPIYYNGTIVSYQERDIRAKFYKACPKEKALINYKDIVYPLDYCYEDWVVVVEGIFDAYRLGDNAVCTFGTSWTKKQATLLTSRFKRIIIMYDDEPEAQLKAKKLGIELDMMGCDVELESDFLRIMGVNDPDELSNKQARIFMELLKK